MTKYNNISGLILAQFEQYKTRQEKLLREHTTSKLKEFSTPTRWEQYQNGKITEEEAINLAIIRNNKRLDKECKKELEKLERVANAPTVESVSISVTWKKNSVWGYNPTAEVTVNTIEGFYYIASGHASGCGYDKETAAVGEALNQIESIIKLLADKKEAAINSGIVASGEANESNKKFIAYGAGYGAIPYFEGGVGMSSFENVFNACGLRLKNQHHTKISSYYYYEKIGGETK